MSTMRRVCGALVGVLLLCGCAETQKMNLPMSKYNPVKIYNAPFDKVYAAAKKAMAAEKYELEVEQANMQEGSGTLVTGYILAPSTVHFYSDDKGEKRPCQVKYLIHADLRTREDGQVMLDLRIPESTEFHKPGIGTVWEKTDSMHWRGEKLQEDIAAILAGKAPSPPGERGAKPAEAGKQEKTTGK